MMREESCHGLGTDTGSVRTVNSRDVSLAGEDKSDDFKKRELTSGLSSILYIFEDSEDM